MRPGHFSGAFRLFRAFGIDVYLHWTWFVAVAILTQMHSRETGSSYLFVLLTFLALFAIVVLHEFGHALACRSVGGQARTIVLWPLGGIAFVQPPQRPGAVLWSIAAGPLVNLLLVPVLLAIDVLGAPYLDEHLQHLLIIIQKINIVLFIFNMLPIYPLDGGQILQALLWFFIGRARSLRAVAVIGIIAAAGGCILALLSGRPWIFLLALFVGWQAFNGFRVAQMMAVAEQYDSDPWSDQ